MLRHLDAVLAGQPPLLLAPAPFAAAAVPRCVAAASPASGSAGEGVGAAAAVVQSCVPGGRSGGGRGGPALRPCGLEDGVSWSAAQRLQLRELAQQESGWAVVAAMLPGTPRTAAACGIEYFLQRLLDSTLPLAFGGKHAPHVRKTAAPGLPTRFGLMPRGRGRSFRPAPARRPELSGKAMGEGQRQSPSRRSRRRRGARAGRTLRSRHGPHLGAASHGPGQPDDGCRAAAGLSARPAAARRCVYSLRPDFLRPELRRDARGGRGRGGRWRRRTRRSTGATTAAGRGGGSMAGRGRRRAHLEIRINYDVRGSLCEPAFRGSVVGASESAKERSSACLITE